MSVIPLAASSGGAVYRKQMVFYELEEKGLFTTKRSVLDDPVKLTASPTADTSVYLYVPYIKDLSSVPKLLPLLEELTIQFGKKYPYDLGCLVGLKKLRKLKILYVEELEDFKLLNLHMLKELKLDELTVFWKSLDPLDPKYTWVRIRKPCYRHITFIDEQEDVTTYTIDKTRLNESQADLLMSLTEVLVQKITCGEHSVFQVLFLVSEDDEHKVGHKILSPAEFEELIGSDIPESEDDLWMEDI